MESKNVSNLKPNDRLVLFNQLTLIGFGWGLKAAVAHRV